MSKDKKKDIWDVMFSMDKKHFPISRNYLQEPRGSSNYINSQVKMVPNKDYLAFCEKLNPVELYALDLELNLAFRKLADFILFADPIDVMTDVDDTGFSLPYLDLIDFIKRLEDVLVDNFDLFPCDNLTSPAYQVAYSHIMKGKNPLGNIPDSMRTMAELQFTIEYYIENSNWDWRTKAEAFLRAHYFNNFQYADDDTLIFLKNTCAYGVIAENGNIDLSGACDFPILNHLDFNFLLFDIKNKIHETVSNVASARWEHYKNAWQNMSYSQENPFAEKYNISGLRHFNIHNLHFLNELIYDSESRHLFSQQDIGSFCKMLNIFRSGLESKYIQKIISSVFGAIVNTIGKQHFILGYNYTARDRLFLISLMYQFLAGRFTKIEYDTYFLWSRDNLFFEPWDLDISENIGSTFDFEKEKKSFLPLICFNIFAVLHGKPHDYEKYIAKAREEIIREQKNYGFWTDSNFNPEFMTVLALDAYNVGSYSYHSFPTTKVDLIIDETQTDISINSQSKDDLNVINAKSPIHIENANITINNGGSSKRKTKSQKKPASKKKCTLKEYKEIDDAFIIIESNGKISIEYKGVREPLKIGQSTYAHHLILLLANKEYVTKFDFEDFVQSESTKPGQTVRDINNQLNSKIPKEKFPDFPPNVKLIVFDKSFQRYYSIVKVVSIDKYEQEYLKSNETSVHNPYENSKRDDW